MRNLKHYTIFIFILLYFMLFSVSVFSQMNYSDSLKLSSYTEAAKEAGKNENDIRAAHYYNKAGIFCLEKGLNSKAAVYFTNSAKYNSNIKNFKELKKIYSNLGLIYFNMEEMNKSLYYFNKSLNVRKLLKNQAEISSGLIDIGYVLSVKGEYANAITKIKQALIIAQQINNSKLILICYKMLAESYEDNKETKKSQEYYERYSSFNISYQRKQTQEKEAQEDIESKAELLIQAAENKANKLKIKLIQNKNKVRQDSIKREKEKVEDSLKLSKLSIKQKQDSIKYYHQQKEYDEIKLEEERQRRLNQRLYLFFGLGVILLILIIAFLLFRNMLKEKKQKKNIEYKNKILQSAFTKLEENNKKIAKQKNDIETKNTKLTEAFEKIEEQNKNIESSISYAQNIQKALLPQQEALNKYFKESFILFLPRDKVSGDFFWFNEAKIKNGNGRVKTKVLISAIDCTGHGVPGALLSMIGYNALENIVSAKDIIRPDLILHELHKEIRHTLRQDTTDNKDGMDMALCSYDVERNELEFAGAKNPLIYIKNNELFHLKGGAKPIAGGKFYEQLMKDFKYENHIVKIDQPTAFYIFSDGFPDQIGGPNKRKYLIRRFKKLLLEIHQNPMKDQGEMLNLLLDQWRGEEPQIDDIIIIGFRLLPK